MRLGLSITIIVICFVSAIVGIYIRDIQIFTLALVAFFGSMILLSILHLHDDLTSYAIEDEDVASVEEEQEEQEEEEEVPEGREGQEQHGENNG